MQQVDLGLALEQLADHVRRAAGPVRRVGRLAGMLTCVVEELANRLVGGVGRHHQDIGRRDRQRDRQEILGRIERQLAQRRIDDEGGRVVQHHIAIGRRLGNRRGPDGAAGARLVVDHHLLLEQHAHLGGDDARRIVRAAAC